MLSPEDNELVTRIGPGTPMGAVLRRYWIPALVAAGIGGARRRAGARAIARRKAPRVSRQSRPGRPRRRILSASPRLAVVRAQRRNRAALRLSRLEIRCRRQLPRPDERARAVLPQDPPDRLSDGRDGRRDLGLYGAARQDAGAPGLRVDAGAGNPSPRLKGVGGVQLAAGAGRRHRHLARADPAPHDHAEHQPPRHSGRGAVSSAAGRRSSKSTSPITAIAMSGSDRSTTTRPMSAPTTS